MTTNEGMGRRVIGPETDDDDVIASHAKQRVDNHGDRAKARTRSRRRERRVSRQAIRTGHHEES